jgi:hypothetical protein
MEYAHMNKIKIKKKKKEARWCHTNIEDLLPRPLAEIDTGSAPVHAPIPQPHDPPDCCLPSFYACEGGSMGDRVWVICTWVSECLLGAYGTCFGEVGE